MPMKLLSTGMMIQPSLLLIFALVVEELSAKKSIQILVRAYSYSIELCSVLLLIRNDMTLGTEMYLHAIFCRFSTYSRSWSQSEAILKAFQHGRRRRWPISKWQKSCDWFWCPIATSKSRHQQKLVKRKK